MKAIVLVVLILLAFTAHSQSLKDALFSGKLKADTGAVIRKGDSLKIQENMAQKKAEDSVQKVTADSVRTVAIAAAKEKALAEGKDTSAIVIPAAPADNNAAGTDQAATAEPELPKDNNAIWKSYVDSLTSLIRTEVIPSNRIKKGSYFVLIEYKINPDGQVSVTSVTSDPSNSFLEQNIKDRLTLEGPKMNPIIDANGRARTVNRKQTMTFEK